MADEVEIRVRVRNDSRAGFASIEREARASGQRAGEGFSGSLTVVLNNVSIAAGGVTQSLGGVSGAAGGVTQSLGGVSGAAQGAQIALVGMAAVGIAELSRLAGAALALPGIIASIGAATAAFQVGTHGVGDAFKALFDPPKKSGGGGGGGGGGGAAAAAQRQIRDAIDGVSDARKREQQVAEDTARNISRAERTKAQAAVESARTISAARRDEEKVARTNARSVEDALTAEQDATENLTRAREDATRALEDLREKVSDYALDENGARLSVLAAQAAQRKVNRDVTSTNLERQIAVQNVREAEERLADTRDAGARNAADLAEAERKGGVEGSDRVVDALKRVADAQIATNDAKEDAATRSAEAERRVADAVEQGAQRQQAAQEALDDTIRESERQRASAHDGVSDALQRLADAQDHAGESAAGAAGGTDAYADALKKLSPNAREFMEALKALKPEWDEITKRVQDKLFAGLGAEITEISTVYFPLLDDGLQHIADSMNGVLQHVGEALLDPAMVDSLKSIMDDTAGFFDEIGPGLEDFLVGFGELATIGAEYLPGIGKDLGEIGTKFREWVEANPGDIKAFIEDAGKAFHDLWDIAKLVGESIFEILRGLGFGGEGGDGGLLEALKASAQSFKDFVTSPGMQDFLHVCGEIIMWLIRHFPDGVQIASTGLRILWGVFQWWRDNVWPLIQFIITRCEDLWHTIQEVGAWIRGVLQEVGEEWRHFRDTVGEAVDWIRDRLRGMWDGLADGARGAANGAIWILNGLIDAANWAIRAVNSINPTGYQIGSFGHIGYLAHGGIASGLAVVGERGPELVKLPGGSTVLPNNQSRTLAEQQGGQSSGPVQIELVAGPGANSAAATFIMSLIRSGDLQLQRAG